VVRETPAFEKTRAAASSWRAELRAWGQLFAPALRGRLAAVSALWWSVNFWSATALYFFTLYAFEERGWTAAHLQRLPIGTIPIGFAGYFAAGWIMDRFGRRAAATLYLAGGTAAAALCFQSTSHAIIAAGYTALVGLGGLWTIAATITTELFPTALRATAIGLANNLIGRTGLIVGPIAAGSLAEALGSTGDAVTWLACANLLCIPVVWLLPETRDVRIAE
jgi:putative MFS transporter